MGMPKALGMRPWRCGGGEEGGKGAGSKATKLVVTTDGLWDELQASAKRMRYLCGALTWKGHSQGHYMAGRA